MTTGGYDVNDAALLPLAAFLDARADEIVRRAEGVWESTILLFSQLDAEQQDALRALAVASVRIWAMRLRQAPTYARDVHALGQEWGEQASAWQLHVYSFTKALDLLALTTWEYLAEQYPMAQLTPATVFTVGRSRDQVLDDLRIPLLSTYLHRREVAMDETRFTLQGTLSLPGRSLLLELGNRLQANKERVMPEWMDSVRQLGGVTPAMEELLQRRGVNFVELLLYLLQNPTAEAGAAGLGSVRAIGLESAQAGVSFREMFHALQQLRPILWDTVYEIYRREQYWHPAEFIEVLARLHLLLDLFSEGIGQAYLRQKEIIIQQQAEQLHRRDLKLARDILRNLLPARSLAVPETELGFVWRPAREIGGDFYDIILLDDGDVLLFLGDVSGKGISAALLVSMVKYVLKANAPWHRSPAALLSEANRFYFQDMGAEMFVTLFAARYTPSTGRLVYTSAGHDPCYLCRANGKIEELTSQGPVLGVFPEISLRDRRLRVSTGDTLFLYTDGLVNVRCEPPREIDCAFLCAFLAAHRADPPQRVVSTLIQELLSSCETTDDITMLLLKRTGGAP
jgi:serine phosphatase RsbU (regulator of sigma subunit)